MGFIGDHRVAAAGQGWIFIQGIEQGREGLDGNDNDAGLVCQCLGKLLRLALIACRG